MIQYSFAFLLLTISSITFVLYLDNSNYKTKKVQLIEEYNLDEKISSLSSDESKSVRVKQIWKDCSLVAPFNGASWSTGYYLFTVLITLSTIISCAIQQYKADHYIFGIVWRIGMPIIVSAVIWIVYLIFKKRNSYFCTAVSDLNNALDCEYESYYDVEKNAQAVFENELHIKEKANRYYSVIGIILLIAVMTLATSFFGKSEYEIEEEQQAIEDAYQKGYEDGYSDAEKGW